MSICFACIPLPGNISSTISKALEHNNVLKSFEASNYKAGESDLVPLFLGQNSLNTWKLEYYYLSRTEFFSLVKKFIGKKSRVEPSLELLRLEMFPEYRNFSRTFLKFGTSIAEKCLFKEIYCRLQYRPSGTSELISFMEKVGNIKL